MASRAASGIDARAAGVASAWSPFVRGLSLRLVTVPVCSVAGVAVSDVFAMCAFFAAGFFAAAAWGVTVAGADIRESEMEL